LLDFVLDFVQGEVDVVEELHVVQFLEGVLRRGFSVAVRRRNGGHFGLIAHWSSSFLARHAPGQKNSSRSP
jgi:hypothetical protein